MPESHHRFASHHLGNERSIWLRPPRAPKQPAQLLVFLDGERYRERVGADAVLDTLDAEGVLPNTLIAFVSESSAEARWLECPCHPPFARFLNDELLPWLVESHPEVRVATRRVLTGLSYTGLAAAFAAFQRPGRWTHVISQSGSHWSNDCWLTQRHRELTTPLPTRYYLDVGRRETQVNVQHRADVLQVVSQIEGVRRFRDALQATGHLVEYVEFDGAHEYPAWRQTLPGALRWAFGES